MKENIENRIVILYFYCNRGLALLNSFHSLGLLILGAYFTLKLTNPLWLGFMSVLGVVILTASGWYAINKVDRQSEKLSVSRGTHYQISQYHIILEQRDILRQILKLLNERK